MSNEAKAEQARKDAAISKLQRCVADLQNARNYQHAMRQEHAMESIEVRGAQLEYDDAVAAKEQAMRELEAITASFSPTGEQADKALDAMFGNVAGQLDGLTAFPARDDLSQELAEPPAHDARHIRDDSLRQYPGDPDFVT